MRFPRQRPRVLGGSPSRELQQLLFLMLQRCRSLRQLLQLHGHLIVNGLSQKNFILAKLMSFCVTEAGELGLVHAATVLRCVSEPSATLVNQMIRGYSLSGNPRESVLLYKRWCAGLEERHVVASSDPRESGDHLEVCATRRPNSFTYSFVLGGCVRGHLLREGEQMHARLVTTGFGGNAFLRTSLIDLYSAEGVVDRARTLFDDMSHRSVVTWNVMLAAYLRSGDSAAAFEFFESMPQRDAFSWTSMIAGCVRMARSERAVALFEGMLRARVEMDQVTMVAVLSACADLGDLELGRRIHRYVVERRSRFKRRLISLENSLINMYAKCGAIGEACKVFWEMVVKDTVSWNTMIMGLAKHGRAGEVLSVFRLMLEADAEGERPDEVTLLAVLCACGYMGWVEQGLHYFDQMIARGIHPRIEHYGCIVDMLSRAGLLAEAQDLVEQMPVAPNAIVWGALLKGCIAHCNDVKLASSIVLRTLLELAEPNEIVGHAAALSNLYAAAMRWGDALRLRTTMTKMCMRKPAGRSWVMQVAAPALGHGTTC